MIVNHVDFGTREMFEISRRGTSFTLRYHPIVGDDVGRFEGRIFENDVRQIVRGLERPALSGLRRRGGVDELHGAWAAVWCPPLHGSVFGLSAPRGFWHEGDPGGEEVPVEARLLREVYTELCALRTRSRLLFVLNEELAVQGLDVVFADPDRYAREAWARESDVRVRVAERVAGSFGWIAVDSRDPASWQDLDGIPARDPGHAAIDSRVFAWGGRADRRELAGLTDRAWDAVWRYFGEGYEFVDRDPFDGSVLLCRVRVDAPSHGFAGSGFEEEWLRFDPDTARGSELRSSRHPFWQPRRRAFQTVEGGAHQVWVTWCPQGVEAPTPDLDADHDRTVIGRFDFDDLDLKPCMELLGLRATSDQLWVDETGGAAYLVVDGIVLRYRLRTPSS